MAPRNAPPRMPVQRGRLVASRLPRMTPLASHTVHASPGEYATAFDTNASAMYATVTASATTKCCTRLPFELRRHRFAGTKLREKRAMREHPRDGGHDSGED